MNEPVERAAPAWIARYPPGVPAVLGTARYASIVALLEHSADTFGERVAFRHCDRSLTFAALRRLSYRFAVSLQAAGVGRGDRVALMLPNSLEYPIAMFGALRAGGIVVNVNPFYTPPELAHQLQDCGACAIVVGATGRATLAQLPAARVPRLVVDASMLAALATLAGDSSAADAVTPVPVPVAPDDVAFLQYTGGTTGISKGAMLLHRNVLSAMQQYAHWLAPALGERRPLVVTVLPLYHVYALTVNCLCMLEAGAENLLVEDPRDVDGLVGQLGRRRFSVLSGVNTIFQALLDHPAFGSLDFSALDLVLGGGMATRADVAERWRRTTGVWITETYGLTECSPAVTANLPGAPFNGSVGLPLPSTQVEIRGIGGAERGQPQDGQLPVPPGEPGEICVRGPQVMAGYWRRPDETREVLGPDGFLRTGDVGLVDAQGFVRLLDRKKDMILVSGFNVYPGEIEQVLLAHPGVSEAVAVGIPDPRAGELPKVFVVRRDLCLSEQDVIDHCRRSLAAYKCPRQVEFRTALPKSPVGKFLRRELKVP